MKELKNIVSKLRLTWHKNPREQLNIIKFWSLYFHVR